jgi:hypothetical protein
LPNFERTTYDDCRGKKLRLIALGRLMAVSAYLLAGFIVLTPVKACSITQGAPPPPIPPGPGPGPPIPRPIDIIKHRQDVRRRLENAQGRDADSERVIRVARRILLTVDQKINSKDYIVADRLIGAADAFAHAAEHASHLVEGPKGPVPRQEEISDHLQRAYFRLQQADFFSRSSGDPDGAELAALAREYYEKARKHFDERDWFSADEYAKSADDLTRGLENLAQAAMPQPPLPPRPR